MSLFHQCKAYKTEEGKANIKALVAIDLLELRHVPKRTNKLLVLEPTQKQSARSNRPPPGGQPIWIVSSMMMFVIMRVMEL